MNNLKTIFGLHISRNVNSKSSSQGIHQGENILRNKYLRSKSLKNVKSDPFLKSTKPNDDKFESNIVKVSNKTKTIYGGSRKSTKLERSNSLDSVINASNHHIVGFKNCISNRVDSNEKQTQNSSKERKISKQNLLNQEARSYAKLIANYSRAMETDTIYTRDFNQTYGRSSSSITDSPFNSLIPPFSKMKKKEIKSGTILNTRNSSSASPKDRRARDIWHKSGNQNSFYSTDSDTYKEIVKTGDHVVTNPQNMSNTNEKQEFKLDVKDVLECVAARADWLDQVIKAHKELKTKNTITIQNNYNSTNAPNLTDQTVKKNVNDSKPVSLLAVDVESPIESSFKPVIDSYASPTEIKSNVDQVDRTEFKTSSNSVESSKNYIEQSSKFTGEKKSIFETENPKTKVINSEKGKSDSESSTCVNFQINGKPSSEYLTGKNESIKVVNSLEKIEIRIPISFLFSGKKNKDDDEDDKIQKIKKSDSTLSLQISAKIETVEEHQKVAKEVSPVQKLDLKTNEKVQKAEKSSVLDLKSKEKAQKSELDLKSKEKAQKSELDLKSKEKPQKSELDLKSKEKAQKTELDLKSKEKITTEEKTTPKNLAKNPDNETMKKQKKTMNSPIEEAMQKQKEQKEEKITVPLAIERKNSSNIETMKAKQESRTIDKVTTKTAIDQKVVKKLNDNVTPVVVGCKENRKKTLNPTGSLLKTKLKNPTEEVSSKKTIASSITEEKYSATKESSEASKIYHTMDHGKQRTMINIDSKDPLKLRIDNKIDFSTRKDTKTRRDNNNNNNNNKKDIPLELKPLEKKKDGTLIDYGLKVATRKNKEQPIKATIKEILTPKEKKFGNFPNESLKAQQIQQKKENNHQVIGDSKGKKVAKTILSVATTDVEAPIEKFAEKEKFVEYKMILKLQDFEENHIFSGTKSSRGNDSKNAAAAGVLKSSMSARSERKNTTVKPDNKGSHAKTQNSTTIIDRGLVAVQIDDYSRNHQSTGKINSMRKSPMKLFSKTSQCNDGAARSADYVERLAKTSLKKSLFSEKSMTISSASLLRDKFKSSDKEIFYSSWLQNYSANVKVSELNR